MKFKFILVLLAVTAIGQLFGYSWNITNGTNKNLYIHLTTPKQDGITVAGIIGRKGAGALLTPGQSTGGSSRFPEAFSTLVIADDEALTAGRKKIKLNDNRNINYTIQSADKGYTLKDNNK
jgi:hypothetical protein